MLEGLRLHEQVLSPEEQQQLVATIERWVELVRGRFSLRLVLSGVLFSLTSSLGSMAHARVPVC